MEPAGAGDIVIESCLACSVDAPQCLFTDRISVGGNAIAFVRLSVCTLWTEKNVAVHLTL